MTFVKMNGQCEYSMVTVSGVMHQYQEDRWLMAGLSRVGIYHNTVTNLFRIVGRKLDEHEVLANCVIDQSFCYDQSTPSFHQWRDTAGIYGIKFNFPEDADLFADTIRKIMHSFDKVNQMTENDSTGSTVSTGSSNGSIRKIESNKPIAKPVVWPQIENCASVVNSSAAAETTETSAPLHGLKPVPPPPPPPQTIRKTANTLGKNFERDPPPVKAAGSSNFMNEIEQTLAKRRAKIDSQIESQEEVNQSKNREQYPSNYNSSSNTVNNQKYTGNSMENEKKTNSFVPLNNNNSNAYKNAPSVSSSMSTSVERLKDDLMAEIRQELLILKRDLIESFRQQLANHR